MTAAELEKQIWQLMKAGKLDEAAAACDQLNQSFPNYAQGWNTSSRLAMSINEPVLALHAVERALQLAPEKAEFRLQKMACLAVLGDLGAAGELADELAEHEFDTAYHASKCAATMNQLERYVDAERQYRRAVELNPDNPALRINLATAQRFIGDADGARENIEHVLAIDPANADAHLLRAGLKTYDAADNNIESLHAALDKLPQEHPGRVQIHFALAKELNDLKRYAESFAKLQTGAAEHRNRLNYDAGQDREAMRAIREIYSAEAFAEIEPGFVNAEPIFIIGMPRSGATIVERILNKHSVVQSIGASQKFGLELVNQSQKKLGAMPADSRQLMTVSRQLDFAALGEAYVASARPAAGAHAYFVDRLPVNFLYAGLIHKALPKAKMILVERDPLDNCYAMFKTLFPGAYPYSYDLDELANYYVEYYRVVNHWQDLMPDVIHTVQYENIVTNPRLAIEDLLQYCDLSFEENCLHFYDRSKYDATASAVQVRHELYVRAIGHSRNYREQLQPVVEILKEGGINVSA